MESGLCLWICFKLHVSIALKEQYSSASNLFGLHEEIWFIQKLNCLEQLLVKSWSVICVSSDRLVGVYYVQNWQLAIRWLPISGLFLCFTVFDIFFSELDRDASSALHLMTVCRASQFVTNDRFCETWQPRFVWRWSQIVVKCSVVYNIEEISSQ